MPLGDIGEVHRWIERESPSVLAQRDDPMTISIRLTDDEEERLNSLVRRTGRSKSFYVRTALHAYLTDLEATVDADAAIGAFEAGGRRSRPLSAIEAETD